MLAVNWTPNVFVRMKTALRRSGHSCDLVKRSAASHFLLNGRSNRTHGHTHVHAHTDRSSEKAAIYSVAAADGLSHSE